MSIQLNPYFKNRTPSSTLAINEEVKHRWAQGKRVLHMGFGESRFAVHPKLQKALQDNSAAKSYLPSKGLPELRQAVATYYNDKLKLNYTSEQVLIGPGSKALIYALQLVLDADLFMPTPSWVSYAPQAELLQNNFFYIPSEVKNGHEFSLEAFAQTLKQSTNNKKLLILNSPNNPTGKMLSKEFLKELAEFCKQKNILVISDEIYFRVAYGDIPHYSIAKYYPEGTLILGGLSKHLSIGGWRMGVALLPNTAAGKELMQATAVVASEVWSSVAAPIQYAAVMAYSNDIDIETYIQTCTEIHGVRTNFIYDKLHELGIVCTKPTGAFYITANFDPWAEQLKKKGISTSSQLAKYLLNKHDLATLSADSFGIQENTLSLRLASSYLDMEKDTDSERLIDLYNNSRKNEFMHKSNHPNMHAAIQEFSKFIAWIES